jgi:hypothetical protein
LPDQKLTDFLTDLAKPQNSQRLKKYLHSKEEREQIVDASDLPAPKKQALKENNFTKVKEIIHEEDPGSDVYLVPMGQQISSL